MQFACHLVNKHKIQNKDRLSISEQKKNSRKMFIIYSYVRIYTDCVGQATMTEKNLNTIQNYTVIHCLNVFEEQIFISSQNEFYLAS